MEFSYLTQSHGSIGGKYPGRLVAQVGVGENDCVSCVDRIIYFLWNKKNLIQYNLLFHIFQDFNELSDKVFQREIGGLGQYSVIPVP